MGQHTPRTAADELHDANAALDDAHRALKDLRSHLDRIISNPEGAAGKALAARRNSEIATASVATAQRAMRAAERDQLSSVS